MIKFRFHKGSLADSMATYKEYNDIAEMLKDIEKESDGLYKAENIVISESHGIDERIGWKSWRYVCVKELNGKVYEIPQCFGMCDFGEVE